jgi:hypothetical protein
VIRLNDAANGPGPVCENRDNEAGILIAASLSHLISDFEFCHHLASIPRCPARDEPPSRGAKFKTETLPGPEVHPPARVITITNNLDREIGRERAPRDRASRVGFQTIKSNPCGVPMPPSTWGSRGRPVGSGAHRVPRSRRFPAGHSQSCHRAVSRCACRFSVTAGMRPCNTINVFCPPRPPLRRHIRRGPA